MDKKIQIVEVGPRDGFQNVKKFIETDIKENIVKGLYEAGIRNMEVTSFVSPKAIPQMADAAEVAKNTVESFKDMRISALVPNLRGAENAYAAGIREVVCVISASEAHNMENVRRTIDQSIEGLKQIVEAHDDLKVRLDIATAFGCPFQGKVSDAEILRLVKAADDLGIKAVTLCDTIGIGNPALVKHVLGVVKEAYPDMELSLHFHNTRGMGLANICAAIDMGVYNFETSVGGLGGCPFAPGSEGNTSTEDTVNMLIDMGYDLGIDLNKYLEVVQYVSENVEAPLTGKMLKVVTSSCMNVSGRAS